MTDSRHLPVAGGPPPGSGDGSAGGFDTFNDGFGDSTTGNGPDGFDPTGSGGGANNPTDTFNDVKDEIHENMPPPEFDPSFKPPCPAGSSTGC